MVHCSSHVGALDEVSLGNAYADAVAKRAALEGSAASFLNIAALNPDLSISIEHLTKLQEQASE